jgi:hypothetical protein
MQLRQVALVAEQLAPVRDQIFRLLGLTADFEDEGVAFFGLKNSVMAIGNTFLEVVSPDQEGTTAGRLLERRGGDGGYMVIAQVDNIRSVSERIDALGFRKVWETERPEVTAFHVHPKDIGAAIVSFDEMRPVTEWLWAGPDWRENRASNVSCISTVDVQAGDPEELASRWSKAFDVDAVLDGNCYRLDLKEGAIRILEATDGRGDGVAGLTFDVTDAGAIRQAIDELGLALHGTEVEVCGSRFEFRGL